jgi:dihydropyrimidine dehydrogenase (NAD+) subunit PreT
MAVRPEIPSLRVEAGAVRPQKTPLWGQEDPWVSLTRELRPPLSPAQARLEAYRCLECGGPYAPAPCTVACPADVDVPGFITAIAEGDATRAADIILTANPLGGTCARVCPTPALCEGACVLTAQGQRPVDIGRLQRFAVDEAQQQPDPLLPPLAPPNGRRVAVLGAGPAGMACAAVLASLGYAVTVYDDHPEPGGLVRYAIAPYRIVRDPLPWEMERLRRMGVRFSLGSPVATPEDLHRLEEEADAIFLGVGMGADASLGVPGEDLEGVWRSLPFIEAIKTGHAPRVGDHVAVVGGGNTAMDVAREALRLGARQVTVVYRRTRAEMPAYAHEVQEAEEEGVQFLWLTVPVRLLGERRLQAMECRHVRLASPDASGRRRPEPVEGTEFLLPVDTVILAIGQEPRLPFLSWIPGLEVAHGRIVADPETGKTGNPRYFAGGDDTNGGDTVVEAVRLGKKAAWGIHRALSGQSAQVSP